MLRLVDVVRMHGPAYVDRFRGSLLPSHARAMDAILRCRTPQMGGHVAVCAQCGTEHLLFHSCRNRACPQCGFEATCKWVERQKRLLIPVTYFHLVFTLPAELRRLVRTHQTVLFSALFQAASASLTALCHDPKYLGAEIGGLSVLHTWTRTLEFHPHIHMLVPGVGLDPDGITLRLPPRRKSRFLVPIRPLAKIFRAKFLSLARHALPPDVQVPTIPWGKHWVVFAKHAVQGAEKVIEYLGRYVHKTALSDQAILQCTDQAVTFQYRDSRDGARKQMTLPAHEFLRRFLQHVLPQGLHRVRAFGLLHPVHRESLRRIQLKLASTQAAPKNVLANTSTAPRRRCPACGKAALVLMARLSPAQCLARQQLASCPARGPPSGRAAVPEVAA